MKIIKSSDRALDKYLEELPVLYRTPGTNDGHYLRVSASVPGEPWEILSNEASAVDQLDKFFEKYGCELDVEVFIRTLNDDKAKPITLKLSYPS